MMALSRRRVATSGSTGVESTQLATWSTVHSCSRNGRRGADIVGVCCPPRSLPQLDPGKESHASGSRQAWPQPCSCGEGLGGAPFESLVSARDCLTMLPACTSTLEGQLGTASAASCGAPGALQTGLFEGCSGDSSGAISCTLPSSVSSGSFERELWLLVLSTELSARRSPTEAQFPP